MTNTSKYKPLGHRRLLYSLVSKYRKIILYGMIGLFCSGLDFVIYTLLCCFNILPYLYANVLSIHIGIFTSFFLNRQINFRIKDHTSLRFITFYAVGLIGLAISTGMLYVLVDMAHLDEMPCKLLTIIVVALVQFCLNNFITFRKQRQ